MSGDIIHSLLREIRAKQDEQSTALGAVDSEVKALRGELQDVRGEVREVRAAVNGIRVELDVVHSDSHDMRGEIHQIRGDVGELQVRTGEVRNVVIEHSLRFDYLDERFELVREGTISAIGFAVNASESSKTLKTQFADLAKRVEKLERRK